MAISIDEAVPSGPVPDNSPPSAAVARRAAP